MAQWYPKMAEYDVDGWNADPYIGKNFTVSGEILMLKLLWTRNIWSPVVDTWKMPLI